MTETLPIAIVGIRDEDELLEAIRRYRGLRTYPTAHDASQRRLHEHCASLAKRGLVTGTPDGGSAWIWRID